MRKMRLKLLFVCAVMLLLLGTSPKAMAIVVGFNADIHMDVPGVIANDFHVQGRIESGDPCGNWSKPPILIDHIDDRFPNFKYSVAPDPAGPGQNWYIVTADWSGMDYPYCSILHLGLFFDATCHNVVVDLVGWWTKDGLPIPPVPLPPVNGGTVPIPGFNVQDLNSPQIFTLRNDSQKGGGGGGGSGGIETEIVQMDMVGMTKEELETHLGPIPQAFEELRADGNQASLPWVPVANQHGIISEMNPIYFLPDSFFDVFLDASRPLEIHPMEPITIPEGGFLVARERQLFVNNAGEYEYRWVWHIHEAHSLKPLIEHSKWSQPPVEMNPQTMPVMYFGWNEPSYSVKHTPKPVLNWKIVADDFRCIGSMPITSIHWWGSYTGWQEQDPPGVRPTSWRIGFWSNIPQPVGGGFSYPGKLLWQIEVPASRVSEEWAGIDQFPDTISDTCFQYNVTLNASEYFWQNKYVAQTQNDVFWISIVAMYPGVIPQLSNPWGWKTRPAHWMDDAVSFTLNLSDIPVGYVVDPLLITPLKDVGGESYDAAFELNTDPNYIKWEQTYTGIRDWPHYEDEESMATVDTVVEPVTKWSQPPDLSTLGIDVDATGPGMWPPQVQADDFKCTATGPITDIIIWGSWYHNAFPPGGPQGVLFTLSLHADIPANQSPTGYSMPGQLLWSRQFTPTEFEAMLYSQGLEGYYVPCIPLPNYWPNADSQCWLYHFPLHPGEFIQQGSTTNPVVYWLDVQAQPIGATNPEIRFGWKTSTVHNIDAAVWIVGMEPVPPGMTWQMLTYPMGHPYQGQPIDLAFEIRGQTQSEQFNLIRQVADDWKCERRTPVTAAVWWGSYIDYRYETYQGAQQGQPVKPDYFLLSIWNDVAAATVAAGSSNGVVYVYDTAGNLLWSFNTGANVASVDVSSDGAYIAVGSQGNKLYLFARDGTKLWEKSIPIASGGWGVGQESKTVAISAYGEYVVAGCTDKLYVYKKDGTLNYSNTGQETCVEISPGGNYIASCNNADGTVHLFSNSTTGCTLLWTKTISNALCIATSDSGYVAVSDSTKVYLYNSAGTQIWSYSDAKWDGDIIRVDMPQDGLSVVAANDDPGDNKGCVLCYWNHLKDGISGWSATDSTPVWTYAPAGGLPDFYSVAISGNGSYIATGPGTGSCLFASTSNVPLQTYGMGTSQSFDLTDTGFGACGDSQGNLYYFSKNSNIPLWNKALGGNVHTVAVSRGSDQFSHPGSKIWEYKAESYDEVLVGYDKHPEAGDQVPGPGFEPVFRYSVKLPKENWFLQTDVNNVFWFSAVAVYDVNSPNYNWGWTNHKHVFNDDAAAWYQSPTGGWIWEELYDQTGASEDMSFILFTTDCLIGGNAGANEYSDWIAWGRPDCWCYPRQCRGDADGKKVGFWVSLSDLTLLRLAISKTDAQLALVPNGICADFDHKKVGFRVSLSDLTILRAYISKADGLVPICDQAPIITGPYNFWTKP